MSQCIWTCASLESNELHHIEADNWMAALEQAPEPCFIVLHIPMNEPKKRFMACVAEGEAFPVPGGYCSDTAEKAAAALREYYQQIRDRQRRHGGATCTS
ncbi:hypothetical protein [Billgrantia antri]|uniref:Uncharacterized protein n=1 Tax=Billgrantia antri TaxID=2846777 RepID=A0ABS6ZJH2_9GAMM|nr:hypothetical protein [Halomonas antri]MBW6390213.1 hypothetical protein [Halomonas antri]